MSDLLKEEKNWKNDPLFQKRTDKNLNKMNNNKKNLYILFQNITF